MHKLIHSEDHGTTFALKNIQLLASQYVCLEANRHIHSLKHRPGGQIPEMIQVCDYDMP